MNNRVALLIGAAALAIGAIGPWASVLGAINIGPTANTEVSLVVFGGIAALILNAITLYRPRWCSIAVGSLSIAEAVYALVHIQQIKSESGEWGNLIQPGWGLYLTIIAGGYLIASTWIADASMAKKAAAAAATA
jgi:hypothetical protein